MKKGPSKEGERALLILYTILEVMMLYGFYGLYQATNDPIDVLAIGILTYLIVETLSWCISGEKLYLPRRILRRAR